MHMKLNGISDTGSANVAKRVNMTVCVDEWLYVTPPAGGVRDKGSCPFPGVQAPRAIDI